MRRLSALWSVRAELLTAAAILVGWSILTSGVAGFFPAHRRAIWDVSTGVLVLLLTGFKFLVSLFSAGLYTLTRGKDA